MTFFFFCSEKYHCNFFGASTPQKPWNAAWMVEISQSETSHICLDKRQSILHLFQTAACDKTKRFRLEVDRMEIQPWNLSQPAALQCWFWSPHQFQTIQAACAVSGHECKTQNKARLVALDKLFRKKKTCYHSFFFFFFYIKYHWSETETETASGETQRSRRMWLKTPRGAKRNVRLLQRQRSLRRSIYKPDFRDKMWSAVRGGDGAGGGGPGGGGGGVFSYWAAALHL